MLTVGHKHSFSSSEPSRRGCNDILAWPDGQVSLFAFVPGKHCIFLRRVSWHLQSNWGCECSISKMESYHSHFSRCHHAWKLTFQVLCSYWPRLMRIAEKGPHTKATLVMGISY